MGLELRLRPPVIELDAATHTYRDRDTGRVIRSWSQIAREANLLEDLSGVPAHHLENAKARGSQIDDACSLIMEAKFTSVHDEMLADEARPYVEAYREYWRTAYDGVPWFVQTPLYCAEYDYCCTPDWHNSVSVNDIKATAKVSRTWGLQTAAQQLAHGSAMVRRIIWLRPKLKKPPPYRIFTDREMDPRVFSPLDRLVVRDACRGDYDSDIIKRWRAGE